MVNDLGIFVIECIIKFTCTYKPPYRNENSPYNNRPISYSRTCLKCRP